MLSDDTAAEPGAAADAMLRPGGRRMRAHAVLLAKSAVAAALCGVIIARIDWTAALGGLAATGWAPVAAMLVIMLLCVVLSAYKWQILLAIHGIHFSLVKLTRYYFVAVFLNNFLPTSIGGDGYRIYKTFDNGRGKASAVIAVATERLTGFGGLVVLGLVAALLLAADGGGLPPAALGGTLATAAAALVGWRLRYLVPDRLRRAVPERLRKLNDTIVEHFDDYVRQPARSAAVIAISLCFHLGVAFAYYLILRYGAAPSVTLLEVLTVLTAATLVAVLPISINGIGVFEGTFVYLFAQHGVPADVSIVPMILNRGLLIAMSVVGAGAYLLESAKSPPRRARRGFC